MENRAEALVAGVSGTGRGAGTAAGSHRKDCMTSKALNRDREEKRRPSRGAF